MFTVEEIPWTSVAVTSLGVAGGILFFGRFYVQWIVSEVRKKYVIPMAFWYMSILGSLMLFPYAFFRVSPGGTLGLCFNTVIYARNIVLRWKEQGILTAERNAVIHLFAAVAVSAGAYVTLSTWKRDFQENPEFWVWTVVWGVGQGMIGLRFLVQWVVSEWKGRSTVPRVFWQLSIVSSVFHTVYFFHRGDTIFTIGTVADAFVYVRNLYLMRRTAATTPET